PLKAIYPNWRCPVRIGGIIVPSVKPSTRRRRYLALRRRGGSRNFAHMPQDTGPDDIGTCPGCRAQIGPREAQWRGPWPGENWHWHCAEAAGHVTATIKGMVDKRRPRKR